MSRENGSKNQNFYPENFKPDRYSLSHLEPFFKTQTFQIRRVINKGYNLIKPHTLHHLLLFYNEELTESEKKALLTRRSMSLINTLSEETISQIAAGEVVERPSHLVKELVENALDAGADEIEIDFDQGGRFIKVKDNGFGIAREEMSLALARHATSKIKHSEDLWKLKTYGFRGEALASIASVSDLTLISGLKGSSSPNRIRQIFGKEETKDQIGGTEGTTVIVRSLFENMPARFKFLKSEGAENSSIKNTLKALALSQPHISFRVLQKSRLLFYWPRQKNLLERTQQVFGNKRALLYEGGKGSLQNQSCDRRPQQHLKKQKVRLVFCLWKMGGIQSHTGGTDVGLPRAFDAWRVSPSCNRHSRAGR